MSLRWNSDFYIAMEHRDLQANAMAVNNSGSYVLLAGRRYIAIRNLDDIEIDTTKKFPRQSKYEVGAAEWNHTSHNHELCVISCNHRLEILTWRSGELTQTHSLKSHTRVITDLNWHYHDPNLLASCSVDTFINIWDLRDPRRPTISLSAIAEANQVKWNYLNGNLLATAHDGDVKLWDYRKSTAPILYISAHLSKIHGLDWNPQVETQLATSSQDNTVKFFDIHNPKKAEYVMNTNAPVWRARFTPFGHGMMTVVVPQLRRGENSVLLWNTANRTAPVHTFVGHKDVVLEFEWRKQKQGDNDYQLVTWSKDQTLLLWRIEPYLQKLCGHEMDESKEELDTVEALETPSILNQKLHALHQEFSLLNVQIPNLEVIKMDVIKRTCTVRATITNVIVLLLQVSFPNSYPNGAAPTFQILEGTTVDDKVTIKLLQTLTQIAEQRVQKNRTCLEPCLRQLVVTLEQLASDNSSDLKQFDSAAPAAGGYLEPPQILGSYNDACIPFPKTSGAKFCSVSLLVCFGRPPLQQRRLSTKSSEYSSTPRALSSLGNLYRTQQQRSNERIFISNYYQSKQRTRTRTQTKKQQNNGAVVIYETRNLFLINRQLAEKYILDGDVSAICRYNANCAMQVGRWDLVQAWTLAELVASPQQAEEDMHSNAFGIQIMQSLIDYYASQSDIQMTAMLSCIFGKEHEYCNRKLSLKSLLSPSTHLNHVGRVRFKNAGSPYHTIPPADVVAEGWVFPLLRTTQRSSSLDNLRMEECAAKVATPQPPPPASSHRPTRSHFYEYYKLAYAETLHRWDLLYNRAEVLKYMCTPNEAHKGVEFLTDCQHCLNPSKQCSCSNCKKLSLVCVICHVSVKGSANCCLVCGHGGHTSHLAQWFHKYRQCPAGCGCQCLIETATVL